MRLGGQMQFSAIERYIQEGDSVAVRKGVRTLLPAELADLLTTLKSSEQRIHVFNELPLAKAVSTFELSPAPIQREMIDSLPSHRAAQILNGLSPDDRTAFLEVLPGPVVNELIKLLSPVERALTLRLLGYPEHSVGRLMTPDYIAIKMEWTVRHVMEYVKKFGRDSETIDVLYVVDDKGVLIDDIRIRRFLFSRSDATVSDLSDRKFIALTVTDDEETAVQVFQRNYRVALPVVDNHGVLLGIVTIDDILALSKKEDTEDIHKIGGMAALDAPYMQTPFFALIKKRVGWLIILFLGEMFTATAMGYFQYEIAQAVVLALFLPLIISSGGNSGSQASTLIIRAMALGEITLRDWWRVMRREILSGICLGSILGTIGFFRVAIWGSLSHMYGPHWLAVSFTVGFALLGVVLWGTLMGSMLPIILKACRTDPATSSAPFVATLVDVTGIIIYFSIALVILHGTLL